MKRMVSELMHQGVLTCTAETPIQDAARMMVEQDVSALVVVNQQGYLIGVLSRTDLVRLRMLSQDKGRWRSQPVSDIMAKTVMTVQASDTLQQASELMMNRHIHRVVVVEEEEQGAKPIGILSITDIARDMAGD